MDIVDNGGKMLVVGSSAGIASWYRECLCYSKVFGPASYLILFI